MAMINEDKQVLRDLKSAVVGRLHAGKRQLLKKWRSLLVSTDSRLLDYTVGVIDHPDDHNVYEILGIERFFRMLENHDWNAKAVKRFFNFYETIKFSGLDGRRRYKLTPVQCFQFANIFGFRNKQGYRLIRNAYFFVPRKFSKTTSAAALAIYDMLFGDNNAQAYIGANSYKQAKVCFDEIRSIMYSIDAREKHFKINREKIEFKDPGHDSFIMCLTANAKSQDGYNASLVIMDEYAQARNTATKNGADLKNVLTTSMGARREPLTLIITTASDVLDGPFVHELEGVKAVLRGEVENDRLFASIFEPDVDDAEDDPHTWAKVQPHLGVTVQADYYAAEYSSAKLSAESMLAFRTKMLNLFVANTAKTWFNREQTKRLVGDFDITRFDGHPSCAVAFDLSVHDDFSAVSYTIYSSASKHFYSHTDYYFPEGALAGHPNEQLYRRWHADGHLRLCKGNRIDVRLIAEDILKRSKLLNIVRIGYDAYKSQELVNILATVGAKYVLQPYRQTYGEFNLPVESFEMLAYDEPPRITLNANPINEFCLSNCVIDMDNLDNKKPIKISHKRKIDGTITMLMTLGLLYRFER